MNELLATAPKLFPAFLYVGAGYLARRFFYVDARKAANLLFYVLIPVIVFQAAVSSDLLSFAAIASFSFVFSALCAAAAYPLRRSFEGAVEPSMLMGLMSYFNIGWFGIPVALALYGPAAGIVMTALYVGGVIWGNTGGYVLVTDVGSSPRRIVRNLLRVPALHSFLFACVAKTFLPGPTMDALRQFELFFKASSFLTSLVGMGLVGMSMVGVSLSDRLPTVFKLLAVRFLLATCVLIPLAIAAVSLGLLSRSDAQLLFLLPCLPVAANILVFMTKAGKDTRLVSMVLFFSTLGSFFLILALGALRRVL